MIKILFLVETGHGMGHIIRSLNLAKTFEKRIKVDLYFLTNGTQGIEKIWYPKEPIDEDNWTKIIVDKINEINPDILIIDILDINIKILEKINERDILTVIIFDFIFNKNIPTDVIINPNINMINYSSEKSVSLLGPKYMFLGEYFQKYNKEVNKKVDSVMISMGGSDPKNYTSLAIDALKSFNLNVDVVAGLLSKNNEEIEKKILHLDRFNFKYNITNEEVSKLMLKNDILLSTAGNTMYEAASIGLPNIVFCNHQKHDNIATSFENHGAIINLGIEPKIDKVITALNDLINDYNRRKNMNKLGKKLVDGKGTERSVKVILNKYRIKK